MDQRDSSRQGAGASSTSVRDEVEELRIQEDINAHCEPSVEPTA